MDRGSANVAYIYDLNGSGGISSPLGGGVLGQGLGSHGTSSNLNVGSAPMMQQSQHPSNMGAGSMGCGGGQGTQHLMPDENYCLRWNDYEKKYAETFRVLRDDEYFTDVTLATEGHSVKAHRVILSACSNYFHAILKTMSPWQHPVLLLHDVRSSDLNSLMDFIYFGQASVSQDSLQSFLRVAEKLKIKGLCETLAPPPPPLPSVLPSHSSSPLPVMRNQSSSMLHSSSVGPPVSGGNFEGLLPRSPYEPSVVPPQSLSPGGGLGHLGPGRSVSSAPPLAHQSPRQSARSSVGQSQRGSNDALMHYSTPKRPKYRMSPQSILRSQLQLKDSEHVEVKSEPMTILSSQEDVPSSGVIVTEFISAHESDLALQTLSHGISPQFMFSPDPSDNGGGQGGHNGPPPPVATMVSMDDKSSPAHSIVSSGAGSMNQQANTSVHHMHSHLQHHQHHHHDEPQDLTPVPQDSPNLTHASPSNNGGSMQSTPTATPTSAANNSSLVGSPSTPTPPKKDRNSRKTCGFCHKDFHEMSLKRHIKDVHFRNQNTYVICPQCCKQYASQNSLYSHLNRVHGVKKDMMPTDLQIHMVPSADSGSNASSGGGGHSNHTTGNSTPMPQGGDNHHEGIMDLAQHSDNSN